MTKKLLLLLFIAASPALFAQDVDRTKVAGKIYVPQDEDAEGISVYNISSQKGTITNADGAFEIEIAENDRIQITALQYQSFTVVVDKAVITRKLMNIFLNPAINQLEEVVVRPYDLSGNITVDVKKIPTYNITKDWDLGYYNLEYGYQFEPDEITAVSGNAAEEALHGNSLRNGVDFLAVLGGVGQLLFPQGKKITIVEKQQNQSLLSNNIQERFSQEFITANFDIPEDKAVDFLFFAQENGMDQDLLKPKNEMQLMEFLMKKVRNIKNGVSKINFYILLFCFFGIVQLSAQEKSLQGKITNEVDIEGIHVLNISSRFSTITNENGHFSIKANPLDTLLFSSIKYMPEKIVVTEAVFEKGVITVNLSEMVNELDDVFIKPNLSGNISVDLKK